MLKRVASPLKKILTVHLSNSREWPHGWDTDSRSGTGSLFGRKLMAREAPPMGERGSRGRVRAEESPLRELPAVPDRP